jgi:hypothetical protein
MTIQNTQEANAHRKIRKRDEKGKKGLKILVGCIMRESESSSTNRKTEEVIAEAKQEEKHALSKGTQEENQGISKGELRRG